MDSMRQVGAGILLGIISIVMILGGFSLAMVEAGVTPANQPSSPTANTTLSIIITVFPTLTPIMTLTSEETATTIAVSPTGGFTTTSTSILPTALLTTVTQAATLTICPAPAD